MVEKDKKYNENRIELHDDTRFFALSERGKAVDFAKQKRSYLGRCYNEKNNWIGYYVPR